MNEPKLPAAKAQLFSLVFLTILTLVIYIGSAWSPALQDDADAAHAEAAREMVERNDWVTLHINGIRYLEKAPMQYWLTAASYKVFGFTEFATRLPMALATLGLVLVVYFFGLWIGTERDGFYAGLATSASLGVFLFTRIMIPEVILSLCLAIAFYFFLKVFFAELPTRWVYIFYVGMAAAVLTKGLIGLVFPLGAIFWFIVLTKGWRRLLQMRIVSGTLIFLLLAAPWHILAAVRNEKFLWFYFVNEHFLRYLGKRYPVDYDKVPLFAFWALHLVWLFPFTAFLPLALRKLKNLWIPTARAEQLRLFFWLWALVVIIFFSFSTRQEYYTFPAFPALALLLGNALAQGERERRKLVLWGQGIPAALGILIAAVLGFFVWQTRGVAATDDLSKVLTQNPENYRLALGHLSDLTGAAFASLRFEAIGAGIVLALGFCLAFFLRWQQRNLTATIATALTTACFIFFAHSALTKFDPYLSSQKLAAAISEHWQPDDLVVINGEYQGGSSIGFYLPQKVFLLNGQMTGLEFGSHYPDAPKIFLEDTNIAALWRGSKRVFLFTRDEKLLRLREVMQAEMYLLASAGGKSVYSNQKDLTEARR